MPFIREDASGASIQVRVHPRAKKNAIIGELGDALKVSLTLLQSTAGPTRPASIFRETFEGAALFRYHCLRPEQSE
ncbi:MAG TPA: hypothetical protein VIX37_05360 [Candidatus Sulfotelmatobacter sp.]